MMDQDPKTPKQSKVTRHEGDDDDDNPVTKFRLDNGLCHSCGTHLYVFSSPKSNKVKPLTIPGQVKWGRCLYCYLDKVVVPGGDGDKQEKKTSHKDFFGSRDDDDEEEGDTGDAAGGKKDVSATNDDVFGHRDSDHDEGCSARHVLET